MQAIEPALPGGGTYVEGTALAHTHGGAHRAPVDSIHRRSLKSARPVGGDGQSKAWRYTAVALGDAALFCAHQCGRKPRDLRPASADPRFAQHLDAADCDRLRGVLLGPA